jgi:hypothetical protein
MTMTISGSTGLEFPDGSDQTTAVPAPGTSGNVLTSNGTSWSSSPVAAFVSGTKLLFQQTAAPTGWTKDTSHNNKALRVVSGTASSGGTVAFTTAFASQAVSGTVGNTTLSTSQVPNATGNIVAHGSEAGSSLWNPSGAFSSSPLFNGYRIPGTSAGGATSITNISLNLGFGNGAHNHSFTGTAIDMAVQYVDVIIATKD